MDVTSHLQYSVNGKSWINLLKSCQCPRCVASIATTAELGDHVRSAKWALVEKHEYRQFIGAENDRLSEGPDADAGTKRRVGRSGSDSK